MSLIEIYSLPVGAGAPNAIAHRKAMRRRYTCIMVVEGLFVVGKWTIERSMMMFLKVGLPKIWMPRPGGCWCFRDALSRARGKGYYK